MTVFIAGDPLNNSYLTSLIEAYKRYDNKVICGVRNFFLTNFIPDILHIQWPERIYDIYPFSTLTELEKIAAIENRLKWFKENKTIIIHTIHNIKPHRPLKLEFEKKIFNLFINYSDVLVHHCRRSVEILKENYHVPESIVHLVNHHPDYLVDYVKVTKTEAREKLKINQDVFLVLNFGSQQKYKGEDFIESVFKKIPVRNKFLFTAGSYIYDGYSGFTLTKLKLRNLFRGKVKFKNRKFVYEIISPNDLAYFISCADIVFLGHHESLNSGVLALSATYSKPVVFPDIGCFKEQMNNWIFEIYNSGDSKGAVQAILQIHEKIEKNDYKDFDNSVWLKENSWDIHIKKILDIAEKIKVESLTGREITD